MLQSIYRRYDDDNDGDVAIYISSLIIAFILAVCE